MNIQSRQNSRSWAQSNENAMESSSRDAAQGTELRKSSVDSTSGQTSSSAGPSLKKGIFRSSTRETRKQSKESQIERLTRENEDLQHSLNHIKERHNAHILQIQKSQSEKEEQAKQEYDAQTLRLQESQSENEKLQRSLTQAMQEHAAEIAGLQKSHFEKLEVDGLKLKDDGSIRRNLALMTSDIRNLGKKYCVTRPADVQSLSPEDQKTLLNWLPNISRLRERSITELNKATNSPHGIRLVLIALISDAVHSTILANPFFFLGDIPETTQKENHFDFRKYLLSVWQTARQGDPREADRWRSQTLRFFDPPQAQAHEAADDIRKHTYTMMDKVAGTRAKSFLQMLPPCLLRVKSVDERHQFDEEILSIFKGMGRLSLQLWQQRVTVRILRFEDIGHELFRVESTLLEAEKTHNLDTDRDQNDPDTSLDGRPIEIVVHPAVLVVGTGEGDQAQCTWAKAVVWVGRPDHGEKHAPRNVRQH